MTLESDFPGGPDEAATRLGHLLVEADRLKFGHARQATALAQAALELAEGVNDLYARARALTILGAAAIYQSEYAQALTHLHAAQTLSELSFPDLAGQTTNALSVVYHRLGDYAGGMTYALDCLRLAQEQNDALLEAKVLSNIALMSWDLRDYDEALALHMRVQTLLRQTAAHSPDPLLTIQLAICDLNIALDHYHLGAYEQAVMLGQAVLPTLRGLDLQQPEAILMTHLTLSLLKLGQPAQARQLCERALKLHRAGHDRDYEVYTLMARAQLHLREQEAGQAQDDLLLALQLAQDTGVRSRESEVHNWLSTVYELQGDAVRALHHHRLYMQLERALHAQTIVQKTKVLAVQAKVALLEREAELERQRSAELELLNAELETLNAELRLSEARARRLATHDPLTGLPNRMLFLERLNEALQSDHDVGVLFMDLNGFKDINDTWGHEIGDQLLQAVAERLQGVIHHPELVARYAGDEFVVLIPRLHHPRLLPEVGQRLLRTFKRPYAVGGMLLPLGASVGGAHAPAHATTAADLLRRADSAMYQAKRQGKNRLVVFQNADVPEARLPFSRGVSDHL